MSSAQEPGPEAGTDPVDLVDSILEEFATGASAVTDLAQLEELQSSYLGRKRGRLTGVFQSLRGLDGEARQRVGAAANAARQKVTAQLEQLRAKLTAQARQAMVRSEAADVTLPGVPDALGGLHPVSQVLADVESIFVSMGYDVVDGPEIETDWYNFEALNFPPDHPARDAQDTLQLRDDLLLRTHTSPVQIRYMESHQPPYAMIVPGRVFRRDTPDATHTPMFTQCEGLVLDTDITMADLKGTLDTFARAMFGAQIRTRFRPGYFPFTEPSAEFDAWLSDKLGWVELLGCGMVHPKLLENVGYDPERVQGFAFGMGIERIAAVVYGIEDIRQYYENDLRFLRQFAS